MPSRTSILETITKVTASPPKIEPKLTISRIEKLYLDIKASFHHHKYLYTFFSIALIVGVASWFRGRIKRTRGHFRLEDAKDVFKAPLLGVSTNGDKTD